MLYNFLRSAILPLKEIDVALPQKGCIIELGCGEGVISTYLARNKQRKIIGIDLNNNRIANTTSPNLAFKVGDITKTNFKHQEGFVISDVLHHIAPEKQKKLLGNLHKALKKNGVLVIKEIDKDEFLRSKMSRLWDFILYPNDKINYWSSLDLKTYLIKIGFKVYVKRPSRFFPGSTTLFICTKHV